LAVTFEPQTLEDQSKGSKNVDFRLGVC